MHPHEVADTGYETPCWLYKGTIQAGGYGFTAKPLGDTRYAHVQAYEAANGPVPKGHVLHHLCEQKACVRPSHLEDVTRAHHASIHHRLPEGVDEAIRRATGSTRQIARLLGVSKSHVARIRLLDRLEAEAQETL